MPKIAIDRDEYWPYYSITDVDKEHCYIEAPQEFLNRYYEVEERLQEMQVELSRMFNAKYASEQGKSK